MTFSRMVVIGQTDHVTCRGVMGGPNNVEVKSFFTEQLYEDTANLS